MKYRSTMSNKLEKFLPCTITWVKDINVLQELDAICFIESPTKTQFDGDFQRLRNVDKAFEKDVSCFVGSQFSDKLIIYSPLGELSDFDDVRKYEKAAAKAVSRAIKAGADKLVMVLPNSSPLKYAQLATVLGVMYELYRPAHCRGNFRPQIAFYHPDPNVLSKLKCAEILESGLYVARDIGGGDPEQMAPPKVEEYVQGVFKNTPIKVSVNTDFKDYPLFAAVDRAASVVPRHRGRIITLEYKPSGAIKKTLLLVGKGVTYDTGGADIKAGGIMAGMSRDKCGAAAVAGFLQVVAQLQPSDVHVIGVLCMVRNSVGEESYVADEIITAASGVRVRIGNTDAEGRMCMADPLYKMSQLAKTMPDPHLFTIATLTGHAHLTHGEGYSIVMDNGPAMAAKHAYKLKEIGDSIGNPFEISTVRPEDFAFNEGKNHGEDCVQSNNLPSSRTPRGHQIPAAFLMKVTKLDQHGNNSSKPIKYSHIDIAGSAGDLPDTPTGAPILALVKTHLQ